MKMEPEADTGVPSTGDTGTAFGSYSAGEPSVAVKQELPADGSVRRYDPNDPSGPPHPPEVRLGFTRDWWMRAQIMTRDGLQIMLRGNGGFFNDLEAWFDQLGGSHTDTGGYLTPWSILQYWCKINPSVSRFLTGKNVSD